MEVAARGLGVGFLFVSRLRSRMLVGEAAMILAFGTGVGIAGCKQGGHVGWLRVD